MKTRASAGTINALPRARLVACPMGITDKKMLLRVPETPIPVIQRYGKVPTEVLIRHQDAFHPCDKGIDPNPIAFEVKDVGIPLLQVRRFQDFQFRHAQAISGSDQKEKIQTPHSGFRIQNSILVIWVSKTFPLRSCPHRGIPGDFME